MNVSYKNSEQNQDDKTRLDKWLWAARFFKTRNLAIAAINGGKVHLNGQRVKPAKEVQAGNELTIRLGEVECTIIVRALSIRRGPAPQAALLYEETPESVVRRAQQAEQRRLEHAQRERGEGRPTKKDRRLIHRFTKDG